MKVNLPAGRIQAIDALRGITIFTMIFVNEVAGVSGIPSWMKHASADDDAMTFVDIVFPAFLFIVGMSIPFAAAQRKRSGSGDIKFFGHTIWRAISLIVMGVFMVNAEGGYNESAMGISIYAWSLLFYLAVLMIWTNIRGMPRPLANSIRIAGLALLVILAFIYKDESGGPLTQRWWGILGLIGWAYLLASVLYSLIGGRRGVLFIVICALFAYHLFGHFAFPGNVFFHHLLFSQGGHAVHAAIVLSGVLLSLIVFRIDPLVFTPQRIGGSIGLCIAMLIIGFALRPFSPVSKIYATPSWAAFSISICVAVFVLIFLLTEQLKWRSWTRLFEPAAVNPLLVYIVPFIVYALMKLLGVSFPHAFYTGAGGVAWAAAYAAMVMAVGSVLTRWGLIIRI
jgi:heparan-alpha-glucosaminide N-acetyltransferase